jgi:hypothetical protein
VINIILYIRYMGVTATDEQVARSAGGSTCMHDRGNFGSLWHAVKMGQVCGDRVPRIYDVPVHG